MLGILLATIFAVVTCISGQNLDYTLRDNKLSNVVSRTSISNRHGKFFPFFSVVRFANSQCLANNNFNGTCFTRRECLNYGGTPSGTCANRLGICCVFQKSCGSTTNMNNTYFTNPEYPTTYDGSGRCTITVNRCNENICQLRLDFLDMSLSQPNVTGYCDQDLLLVYGASSQVPRLCGENTNQHVYVDFNGASPIKISVDTSSDVSFKRRWNIRIQQIACDSPWRAPSGCLQYYKTASGTVSSFNYGTGTNPRGSDTVPARGTRQITNLMYGVCIRMALGYCSIEWSQTDLNSFTVSGDTSGVDPSIIGTELVALSGLDCMRNFVIVPNPRVNGNPVNADRFCGNAFATKTSNLKPFVLYVVTNNDELLDNQNRGFMLAYRQLPCAV